MSPKLESMSVLWGRKLDAEEWQEELLCTQAARFDEVRVLAAKQGYGHFRVSVDNGTAPDFSRTLNLRKR